MGTIVGNINIVGRKRQDLPPFLNDLDTWHKDIYNGDFLEIINNLPAKFLPRILKLNGTDDKVLWGTNLLTDALTWSIAFKGDEFTKTGTSFIIGSTGNGAKNILLYRDGKIGFRAEGNVYHKWDGTGNTSDVPSPNNTFFTLVFYADGTNIHAVYDGVYKGYITPVNTKLSFDKFGLGYSDDTLGCDGIYDDLRVWNTNIGQAEALLYNNDEMTSAPNIGYFKLRGDGNYEYDISGNENHGVLYGTGDRFTYSIIGSTYLNDQGYSKWTKLSNPDIQVPFDINGLALSLTDGVNIPTGYAKEKDLQKGGSRWNMADSLVDFFLT